MSRTSMGFGGRSSTRALRPRPADASSAPARSQRVRSPHAAGPDDTTGLPQKGPSSSRTASPEQAGWVARPPSVAARDEPGRRLPGHSPEHGPARRIRPAEPHAVAPPVPAPAGQPTRSGDAPACTRADATPTDPSPDTHHTSVATPPPRHPTRSGSAATPTPQHHQSLNRTDSDSRAAQAAGAAPAGSVAAAPPVLSRQPPGRSPHGADPDQGLVPMQRVAPGSSMSRAQEHVAASPPPTCMGLPGPGPRLRGRARAPRHVELCGRRPC
jgi:hypothetical protein